MAITAKDFAGAVAAISELLPYAKRPSVDALLPSAPKPAR